MAEVFVGDGDGGLALVPSPALADPSALDRSLRAIAELPVELVLVSHGEPVLENGRQKLVSKNLDAIVVNDVSREGVGFDTDRNAVTIITRDDVVEVPETTKWEVAHRVLDQVVRLRQPRNSSVKA